METAVDIHHAQDSTMTNWITFACLTTGFAFHLMIPTDTGAMYELFFKILSLIPVFMAMVINYPKFKTRISNMKMFKKKKRGRK